MAGGTGLTAGPAGRPAPGGRAAGRLVTVMCSGAAGRPFNFSLTPRAPPPAAPTLGVEHHGAAPAGPDGAALGDERAGGIRPPAAGPRGGELPPLPEQQVRPQRRYHLSPKAPPAITQEDLDGLARDSDSVRRELADAGLMPAASTSGREAGNGANGAAPPANGAKGVLSRRDFAKFVQFFRMSSSYIAGHRGRLFIACIPGEVVRDKALLHGILEDISLLNGLGVKLVLAVGTQHFVDEQLRKEGKELRFVGGYRVTTQEAMAIAMQAAGAARTEVESQLSKALAVPMVRRHSRTGEDEHHYGPSVGVVSGNYVTGKRRGIVDGVDFGATGSVRFVQTHAIRSQLELGNIVLLTNLAYSAAGEVLNCNIYDVATHAAIELGADKLICLTLQELIDLRLPQWLPLTDAEDMIAEHLAAGAEEGEGAGEACGEGEACDVTLRMTPPPPLSSSAAELELDLDCWRASSAPSLACMGGVACAAGGQAACAAGLAVCLREPELRRRQAALLLLRSGLAGTLASWRAGKNLALQFPNSVVSAVVACKNGVKRTHIVDARIDGGVLLELYSRDGVGCMISTDLYEGIRRAQPPDLDNILELLEPLVQNGTVRRRSKEEVLQQLPLFTVVERESRVLACVLMQPLGRSPDGCETGELAAFCVHPSYRGSGRGDSLLDYVEQDARLRGIRRLVLLTTRTADWFEQRDFQLDDYAHLSKLLPEARRAAINPERNSKLYYKPLHDLEDGAASAPAGKRIGF